MDNTTHREGEGQVEEEQQREKEKELAKMPELGLRRREPGCRRLEAEPTSEHSVGCNTATVAVAFVVAIVAVAEILTIVEQRNNTWDYTPGNIVENNCQNSFLQK